MQKKIGCDIHKELIALLQKHKPIQIIFPNCIIEDEYQKVKANKRKL